MGRAIAELPRLRARGPHPPEHPPLRRAPGAAVAHPRRHRAHRCPGRDRDPAARRRGAPAPRASWWSAARRRSSSACCSRTRTSTSEQRARDLCRDELKRLGVDIPVFASVDYYPSRKESHRTNTTMLEAYAAEPSRQTLKKVSDRFKKHGAKFDLRVMATHGGTIGWKAKELARTIVSGPIGGVIGSKFLGEKLGYDNIACSDIGGTSFDMALITKGKLRHPVRPRHGAPGAVAAAGGDGFRGRRRRQLRPARPLQPRDQARPGQRRLSRRHVLAGERAGYRVGVSDCHVVLGYLNPDNFLGGAIKLDVQRARKHLKEQIADPLGLSVEDAAAGVIELLDLNLREYMRANISAKGYNPTDFVCFSYGGAGPVHTYGYTEGLGFKDVIVPAWAAGFSAFGCACADFEYRYDKSVDIAVAPDASDADKLPGLQDPAGGLGGARGKGGRGVHHQWLQAGGRPATARLSHAVHGPAERPRDRLAHHRRRRRRGLGQAGPRLRRDLCASLCQRGPLARARLRGDRRDHARQRDDAEARPARGADGRPDAAEGGLHRQAPLLSPQEVGGRAGLVRWSR